MFSSMPKPRRTPEAAIATTRRPSRPRLMKCWSTMPKGKKPSPVPISSPGRSGSRVTPWTTDSIEVPPRIIGPDIIAAPALDPATRPPAACAARMARRTGLSLPRGERASTILAWSPPVK